MRTKLLRTHLTRDRVTQLILRQGYYGGTDTLRDHFSFVRSGKEIFLQDHPGEFQFGYRNGWSGILFPITTLDVVKGKDGHYIRMRFRMNKYGKLIISLVALFALSMVLSQAGHILNAPRPLTLLTFCLLFVLVFTGPFLLIARQARKETIYFMQDLLHDFDRGNGVQNSHS